VIDGTDSADESLLPELVDGLEVSPSHGLLEPSADRPAQTGRDARFPREGCDGERDLTVITPLQEEELLTRLGVARKGALGKAAAARFLNDIDHPAGDAQGCRTDTKTHVHDGVLLHARAGRCHAQSGSHLNTPRHQILSN
jgi:hypothetical protein